MLTDCLTWRELELVHNFACHDRRIRRSARRRLRNSVIVSQLGSQIGAHGQSRCGPTWALADRTDRPNVLLSSSSVFLWSWVLGFRAAQLVPLDNPHSAFGQDSLQLNQMSLAQAQRPRIPAD